MIDERKEELAALGAFDLLEGEEKARFGAELAAGRDAELRALATGLHEAASALAHTAPAAAPPAELRQRLLESIGEKPRPQAKVIPFPALIPWAVAACFAAAVIGLAARYAVLRTENRLLQEQQRIADLELRTLQSRLEGERILGEHQLADARLEAESAKREVAALDQKLKSQGDLARFKISTLVSMLGNTPAAQAVAVWDPTRQQGMMEVSKLPALAAGQDYQLWIMDPQYPKTEAVSGGVFQVDPDTGVARVVFKPGRNVSASRFAVSLERKGGVTKREGPVVLLSQ